MNIREVEAATGLTRANVRFYEKEGLLEPERQENGYRNYTNGHVETLKRIVLLRRLDVSIEEIRKLQRDEQSLTQVLTARIQRIKEEAKKLQEQERVCMKMQSDGVSYHELQADVYLREFGKTIDTPSRGSDPVDKDQEFPYPHNWRRYFARNLDLVAYELLFTTACYLIFRMLPPKGDWFNLLTSIAALVLMYALEPYMLHYFAATPGKLLLGIRVYHVDGRKLTVQEAKARTGELLFSGMGLQIPVFGLYRLWKCYRMNNDGECLPWAEESTVEVASLKKRHVLGAIGAVAALALICMLTVAYSLGPLNRGDVTKAELAENINRYLEYYDLYSLKFLDEECKWQNDPAYSSGVIIQVGGEGLGCPPLELTETDGDITEVSFHVHTETATIGHGYQSFIMILIRAYGGTQPGMNILRLSQLEDLVLDHPLESFSGEVGGVSVTYTISYEGYDAWDGNLYAKDTEDRCIDIYFSIKKLR